MCHAVLAVLGERLGDVESQVVAATLPNRFRQTLEAAPSEGDLAIDEMFAEVRDREEVPLEAAIEHTQVVCDVLAEALGEELRGQLASLPTPLADLFRRAEPALPPGEGQPVDERLDAVDDTGDDLVVDPDPDAIARRWLHDATEDE